MKGIVDRIEENIAVVEIEGKMYNVDLSNIEEKILEGDILEVTMQDERIVNIKKDSNATEERRKYIEDLTKDMWQ